MTIDCTDRTSHGFGAMATIVPIAPSSKEATMQQTTLVIGASGQVGGHVLRGLQAAGHAVRAISSKPREVSDGTVDWAEADLATGRGIRDAFAGVRRAFLFAPPGYADQYAILRPLVEEAARGRLDKVVLMTAMGADAVESAPLRQAELALERSGLPFNIIRPNWFMQNFGSFWLAPIRAEGRILLPAGTAKVSFIDTRDVAEVAVGLLTSDFANGQAFDLTGAEALDHAQVADALSKVTGGAIAYQDIPPEAMKQALLAAGLPRDYADFLLLILGFLAQGYNARTTDTVQQLLGRAPRDFDSYAREHAATWQA
jgi:uncharacterized protein YbjT (DUF2867 family)